MRGTFMRGRGSLDNTRECRLNRDHQGGRELSITRGAQQVFGGRKRKIGKQMKNLHFVN